MTTDNFDKFATGLTSPGEKWEKVAPDDDTDLPFVPRAIHALEDGVAVLQDKSGGIVSFPVLAGIFYPLRPVRFLETNPDEAEADTDVAAIVIIE
jgi:hypothetical protein